MFRPGRERVVVCAPIESHEMTMSDREDVMARVGESIENANVFARKDKQDACIF